MKRRDFLKNSSAAAAVAAVNPIIGKLGDAANAVSGGSNSFEFEEATITSLQDGMKSGALTARSITDAYLKRIDEIDKRGPAINSVIEINPDGRDIADTMDRERKEKGPRGPLHGIPILIKDNIDTADRMLTTAGSLALIGCTPKQDSTVAKKLRDAGAVILGKTNLSEWANFRSSHS